MAKAVEEAGADGITMINTLVGMRLISKLENRLSLMEQVVIQDQLFSQ